MESEIKTIKGKITQIISPDKQKDFFVVHQGFFKNKFVVVIAPLEMPNSYLKRIWIHLKYNLSDFYTFHLIELFGRKDVLRPKKPAHISVIVMRQCNLKVGDILELPIKPVYELTDYFVESADMDNIMT